MIKKWMLRILLGLVLAFVVLQCWFFLQVLVWTEKNPNQTQFMRLALAQLKAENPKAELQHQWVPYADISMALKRAVVASEDSGFVNHDGVEWQAIESAIERNIIRGKITHGGSTITQQLAKNLFLSPQRSFIRKGQELLIAWMIEISWSKQRIFEVYLNVVEWGNGVFGAQAAARHYYGVPASSLTTYQAARLAVMLPSPRYYDRNRQSRYLNQRAATIRARLHLVKVP